MGQTISQYLGWYLWADWFCHTAGQRSPVVPVKPNFDPCSSRADRQLVLEENDWECTGTHQWPGNEPSL
jgi:hypothetical protein